MTGKKRSSEIDLQKPIGWDGSTGNRSSGSWANPKCTFSIRKAGPLHEAPADRLPGVFGAHHCADVSADHQPGNRASERSGGSGAEYVDSVVERARPAVYRPLVECAVVLPGCRIARVFRKSARTEPHLHAPSMAGGRTAACLQPGVPHHVPA